MSLSLHFTVVSFVIVAVVIVAVVIVAVVYLLEKTERKIDLILNWVKHFFFLVPCLAFACISVLYSFVFLLSEQIKYEMKC